MLGALIGLGLLALVTKKKPARAVRIISSANAQARKRAAGYARATNIFKTVLAKAKVLRRKRIKVKKLRGLGHFGQDNSEDFIGPPEPIIMGPPAPGQNMQLAPVYSAPTSYSGGFWNSSGWSTPASPGEAILPGSQPGSIQGGGDTQISAIWPPWPPMIPDRGTSVTAPLSPTFDNLIANVITAGADKPLSYVEGTVVEQLISSLWSKTSQDERMKFTDQAVYSTSGFTSDDVSQDYYSARLWTATVLTELQEVGLDDTLLPDEAAAADTFKKAVRDAIGAYYKFSAIAASPEGRVAFINAATDLKYALAITGLDVGLSAETLTKDPGIKFQSVFNFKNSSKKPATGSVMFGLGQLSSGLLGGLDF